MDSTPAPSGVPSWERLAAAFAVTDAALLVLDASARVEYANPAALGLLGADVPGSMFEDVLHLEEPGLAEDLHKALVAADPWSAVIRLASPAATCRVSVTPLPGAGGFAVTVSDVSAHVAVERELRAQNRALAEQAVRDPLTELHNRTYLREVLDRETARARREDTELTVLMADLDGFKEVNDELGHDRGDVVLRKVADALPEAVRQGDVVVRYGGDEFCILLPHTGESPARAVAERVRHILQARSYDLPSKRITVSIGIAVSPDARERKPVSGPELLRRADQAMLEAKRRGGNRVLAWRDLPTA